MWFDLPNKIQRLTVVLQFENLYHRVIPPQQKPSYYARITRPYIENATEMASEWILRFQEKSGRFNYWYNPITDKYSQPWDDNFLRQAGTAYALTHAYEMTGDTTILEAAKKSIRHLNKYYRKTKNGEGYFFFNDKAKLGGIALPMMAMLNIRRMTADTDFDKQLKELAAMIIYLQEKYGTGQFKSTYIYRSDYEYEKTSGWESKLYPGEALLALAMMYQNFEDPIYKETFDKAIAYYEKSYFWRQSSFWSWTISGLSYMYFATCDEEYGKKAMHLSDKMFRRQNQNPRRWTYGSFDPLPTVHGAAAMEGTIDALRVATKMGKHEKAAFYKERIKMGLCWLTLLQYTDFEVKKYMLPEKIRGGVRSASYDPLIRVDNTQHTLSCFAKSLKFVFDVEPEIASKIDIKNECK